MGGGQHWPGSMAFAPGRAAGAEASGSPEPERRESELMDRPRQGRVLVESATPVTPEVLTGVLSALLCHRYPRRRWWKLRRRPCQAPSHSRGPQLRRHFAIILAIGLQSACQQAELWGQWCRLKVASARRSAGLVAAVCRCVPVHQSGDTKLRRGSRGQRRTRAGRGETSRPNNGTKSIKGFAMK